MLLRDLQEIQREHGYLPARELRDLSDRTKTPLEEIYSVAGFYPAFRLEDQPTQVRVCRDAVCHLHGATQLIHVLKGAAAGKNWNVQETSCLGQCDAAPVVFVGHEKHRCMRVARALELMGPVSSETLPMTATPSQTLHWTVEDLTRVVEPYGALRRIVRTGDCEGAIASLKESGLRGMGGSGFPTGVKWETVRHAPSAPKYVVCNADESEAGAFKDRTLLHTVPQWIIEGALVGAFVVGARQVTIFLRHEYDEERSILEAELERARTVLDSLDCEIEADIFVSPGGYICGEETALLEALEGKRAEPRNRPPFPATHGFHGKPTLLNNVETFAWVPVALSQGTEWFRSQGVNGAAGLKAYSLSGHVQKPGVYVTPMGITPRTLIHEFGGGIEGGRALKAFSPGGVSSGFLPATMMDVPLEYGALQKAGSMLGPGAVVAVAEGTCMFDLALNAVTFFRNESCGKCIPCRAGTQQIVRMLEHFREGTGEPTMLDDLPELAKLMRSTSICGLGQVAANPILLALEHFREEALAHLDGVCPSGICYQTLPSVQVAA